MTTRGKMNIKKKIIVLSSFFVLSSCSALFPSGTEIAVKYLGIAKGVGDVATFSRTGRTINDHLLSAAIGRDCRIGRVIRKKPICIEIDPASHKYSIFKKGKVVSTNNVMKMKFPSEIYDYNKTLEKDLNKKLNHSNVKVIQY